MIFLIFFFIVDLSKEMIEKTENIVMLSRDKHTKIEN